MADNTEIINKIASIDKISSNLCTTQNINTKKYINEVYEPSSEPSNLIDRNNRIMTLDVFEKEEAITQTPPTGTSCYGCKKPVATISVKKYMINNHQWSGVRVCEECILNYI